MKHILIIGSGIAGIATSIRLAWAGYRVSVYEANAYPGGKLSEINANGFRFDAGPSLFTCPIRLMNCLPWQEKTLVIILITYSWKRHVAIFLTMAYTLLPIIIRS